MPALSAAAAEGLASLARLAAQLHSFRIVDHESLPVAVHVVSPSPRPTALKAPSFYLAGVNGAQRSVYEDHCVERFEKRSPWHYSSSEDVAARAALCGHYWQPRSLYEVSAAFVGVDGLVAQPPRPAALRSSADGVEGLFGTSSAEDEADAPRYGKLYTFERLPGYHGHGRLLISLERLGLATIAADGLSVTLSPSSLTPSRLASTYRARGDSLPEERGIENVHAFTYSRTFADGNSSAPAEEATLSAHRCLYVLEQFWTVNYWHWASDALPKALLYAELVASGAYPECRVLAYDFPWTRQYLSLALGSTNASWQVVYSKPSTLYYACRVLLPTPSALDGTNRAQLLATRAAILPRAHALMASAAMASSAIATAANERSRPLVLVQIREGGSVHGDGRSITNLPQLLEALRHAFAWRRPDDVSRLPEVSDGDGVEVMLFDHRGLSAAEQVALYARAAVVIGVHGAGFANVLWMAPRTSVIEIVPMDVHLDFQCGLTPFWLVSELLGLAKHAFIVYDGRMFEPFDVPIVEFVAFLSSVGILPWVG